jgi:ABC-type transporter Mla MlaB component
MPIDPDSAEVQQLKSAAMPLLFQLREDQKNEVRSLARLIGLEKVAAQI